MRIGRFRVYKSARIGFLEVRKKKTVPRAWHKKRNKVDSLRSRTVETKQGLIARDALTYPRWVGRFSNSFCLLSRIHRRSCAHWASRIFIRELQKPFRRLSRFKNCRQSQKKARKCKIHKSSSILFGFYSNAEDSINHQVVEFHFTLEKFIRLNTKFALKKMFSISDSARMLRDNLSVFSQVHYEGSWSIAFVLRNVAPAAVVVC